MFDSLDETIKHDDSVESSSRERIVKALAIAVPSILLFGGLYFTVQLLE